MRDSLELLEWPVILDRILDLCWTPYGYDIWITHPFLANQEEIEAHLAEVESLKTLILRYGEPLVTQTIPDIRPQIERVHKGGLLTLGDLRQVFQCLRETRTIVQHISRIVRKEPDNFRPLTPIMESITLPDAVLQHLELFISADGEILDTASPRIGPLRKRILTERSAIQQKLQSYLYNPDYSQALQAPVITERDGRQVLPVKIEFKTTIPGIIHAGSASGATIFVEPQNVVELNNRLQTTQAELEEEIQQILKSLSAFLETHSSFLLSFMEMVGILDRRAAAARLSRQLKANPPKLPTTERVIELKQARHPLLVFQQEEVVANDITLGKDGIRTLIITGPNTGGKTVLLKTVGLCAVMLQAGLHLPSDEGSVMGLFDPVLVDIGDQQSISQNLSTFSAHLEKLKYFVADETDLSRGLVLIDELAAGTDPAEGAPLAKAVLDELYEKGALTIITTHLGELKVEGHHHPGYLNASVEFNPETLSPTYRVILGSPGTSHAITIAQRLGLKETVIEKARRAVSQPTRDSAALIEDLEQKNRKLKEELKKAEAFRISTEEAYERMELKRQQFQEEGKKTLQLFKANLKSRLHFLEDEIKRVRKQVQRAEQGEYDPDKVASRLKHMNRRSEHLFEKATERLEPFEKKSTYRPEDFRVGEEVHCHRLNVTGTIVSCSEDKESFTLQAGNLRVTVPYSDIDKLRSTQKKKPTSPTPPISKSIVLKASDFSTECDVRGLRVDEAMAKVEKFLDNASLAGFEKVGIIHGMGSGALKNVIRDYLKQSGYVKNFYPEQAQYGGDGKTIVEL